jgi:hypothetical protein
MAMLGGGLACPMAMQARAVVKLILVDQIQDQIGQDSQIWPKLSSNPSFSIFINCNDQMIMLYWINLPTSGSHWCGCATAAGIQP